MSSGLFESKEHLEQQPLSENISSHVLQFARRTADPADLGNLNFDLEDDIMICRDSRLLPALTPLLREIQVSCAAGKLKYGLRRIVTEQPVNIETRPSNPDFGVYVVPINVQSASTIDGKPLAVRWSTFMKREVRISKGVDILVLEKE